MTTRRTKMLFWLSTVPTLFAVGAVAWAVIYATYLTRSGRDTYFVSVHPHLLPALVVAGFLFLCGLVSFLFDRRKNGTK